LEQQTEGDRLIGYLIRKKCKIYFFLIERYGEGICTDPQRHWFNEENAYRTSLTCDYQPNKTATLALAFILIFLFAFFWDLPY
jgi:hypothetical protein